MTGPLRQREQYAKGGLGRWYWDLRDRRTLSYIGQEKIIVDVGCGEGITLEKLVSKFPDRQITGIDYSPENVEVCKERRLPARLGNVYELDFEDESVDCCLFMEVIEHLLDPLKALQEIHRIMRIGGRLLVVFPNDLLFKMARLACLKFQEAFTPSGHVKQWTPKEMQSTMEKAGFAIVDLQCLPFYFWRCSLHCLVVARKK
ncbi:MAG: class I SAM-dependent methyltransferase [Thermodesulfobacteriota bacterium]|nr:class I SAM-dependent methyltransferase [Thermodesulfobacteriota bacterium]